MLTQALVQQLYKKMFLIREVELHLARIYHTDAIKSPVHLSIGQEAVAVGACSPLNVDDVVSNTYRCHATYLAKGGNIKTMFAELYGKVTGCAGGKAGSMHLIDMQNGVLGASAVVGTTIPVATGFALALQREGKKSSQQRLVVSFFGDGGTEEGCFYESLNFAALHHLPIIYICENNRLAIHTPLEKRWATEQLCERVSTFGVEAYRIENQDIFEIYNTVNTIANKIRNHQAGPAFIQCDTYRWFEHVGPYDDHDQTYRDVKVYDKWKAEDQILRLAKLLDETTLHTIQKEVASLIAEADFYADNSAYPPAEELYHNVYAS